MHQKHFLLLLFFFVASIAQTKAQSPQMVSVGDHSLEMIQAGTGPYTVIFEAGFGTGYKVWGNVASEIMKDNTVVLYSRAGTGNSEVNPKPQTLENAVKDLSLMIESANLKPPFIFVGHSYGAFIIRAYAAQNNDKVKGLVFVDPSHEKLMLELKKVDAAKAAKDIELRNSFTPQKFKAENEAVNAIFEKGALPDFGKLPAVPVVVLTSVQNRNKPELFLHEPQGVAVWRKLHNEFFSQFNNGAHFITANSGHNIHREEPYLVVNAIKQVVQLADVEKEKKEYALKEEELGKVFQEAMKYIKKDESKAEKNLFDGLKKSGFDERTINAIAYQQLNDAKTVPLAVLVLKYNTTAYQNSANAYDSYGEALVKQGKINLAKQQFNKAIKLAEASNDVSTKNNSLNNLKKLESIK